MLAKELERGDVVEVYFADRGVLRWVMPTIRVWGGWLCRPVERDPELPKDHPRAYLERGDPRIWLDELAEVRLLRMQRSVVYPTRDTAPIEPHPGIPT